MKSRGSAGSATCPGPSGSRCRAAAAAAPCDLLPSDSIIPIKRLRHHVYQRCKSHPPSLASVPQHYSEEVPAELVRPKARRSARSFPPPGSICHQRYLGLVTEDSEPENTLAQFSQLDALCSRRLFRAQFTRLDALVCMQLNPSTASVYACGPIFQLACVRWGATEEVRILQRGEVSEKDSRALRPRRGCALPQNGERRSQNLPPGEVHVVAAQLARVRRRAAEEVRVLQRGEVSEKDHLG